MNLTTKSKQLVGVFDKDEHYIDNNKQTNSILSELYNALRESHNYIREKDMLRHLNPTVRKTKSSAQIIKPKFFKANSFPSDIIKHIDEFTRSVISYEFHMLKRKIVVHFIVEEQESSVDIRIYDKYIARIMMWLHVLSKYASDQCSQSLVLYVYMTSLEKKLPRSNSDVLDEINVNTAFTTTCPVDSEIVVFRKEEWFKVFIHETFHNFGLDFSDMNTSECTAHILSIFKVDSEVRLYESYTEFWAEMINVIFYSFLSLKDKTDKDEFLALTEHAINLERAYSIFQLVKTLDFMGLEYKELYSTNHRSKIKRDAVYKEKTNVLSYYIVKTVLLNNYQKFLVWCKMNNSNLLQFDKTARNQKSYCDFIEKNYRLKNLIDGIADADQFLHSRNNRLTSFMLSSMRMSLIEMK